VILYSVKFVDFPTLINTMLSWFSPAATT
jgi:hypothetical protein